MGSSANIVVGLVVLAWLLWRQTQRRPVREDRKPTVLVILLVLGAVALGAYFKKDLAVSLGAQRLVVQSRATRLRSFA